MTVRPKLTVERATPSDHPLLDRLMQLYCYDFSEFSEMALNSDGSYADPEYIREQLGPNHDQYVFRVDGTPAGFGIVTRGSCLNDAPDVTDMTQFFVMRAHRRQRVGERAATDLFRRYGGRWEVRVIRSNTAAHRFWRGTIKAFTGANYRECDIATDRHDGPVFLFESRAAG